MSLETKLTALAEAVGTDMKNKVGTGDPRLSDSREWSEATVPQAEAEAGTASTRRAWTAQRVRQAIAAWYLTVSTTFTRTLLGRSTAAEVRGDLGLGTAATRDVGVDDGNVLEVNALGIGSSGSQGGVAEDAENPPWIFTSFQARTLNKPAGLSWEGMGSFVKLPYTSDMTSRWTGILVGNIADGAAIVRSRDGVVSWRELIHTGNLLTGTGQSTQYPMTQKAVTDAINGRGFEDASGILTVTSGALSNDMSAFLSLSTKTEMKAWLGIQ